MFWDAELETICLSLLSGSQVPSTSHISFHRKLSSLRGPLRFSSARSPDHPNLRLKASWMLEVPCPQGVCVRTAGLVQFQQELAGHRAWVSPCRRPGVCDSRVRDDRSLGPRVRAVTGTLQVWEHRRGAGGPSGRLLTGNMIRILACEPDRAGRERQAQRRPEGHSGHEMNKSILHIRACSGTESDPVPPCPGNRHASA